MQNLTASAIRHTRVSKWGEGPIWDVERQRLLYVDIEDHKVVAYDPQADSEREWDVGERVGTVVPRSVETPDSVVIAGDKGFRFLDLESGGTDAIADPEPDKKPENRFNDGKCDPAGRFWAGTISTVKKQGDAALYMLDTDLRVHRKLGGVTNSNGICWSRDARTMFYIDTPRKAVLGFDFDLASGDIGNQRTVIDTETLGIEGSPDGMTIDAGGHLWVAMCHGASVLEFDPVVGTCLRRIEVPAVETTACAFGGNDLQTLFITTGLKSPPEEGEPDAGRLFSIRIPGVTGMPSVAFGA